MKKVTIVGAGNVGASAAVQIANRDICDIMLIDKLGDLAKGKAIDISQSVAKRDRLIKIDGDDDFSKINGSDIIVVTAGIARKPGMTRGQLKDINVKILKEITDEIKRNSPNSIIIIVSNPLDVMTNMAYKYLMGNPRKIVGMGGMLDCLRLASKIQKRVNVSGKDIEPIVIGKHGETMVIVPEHTKVNNKPITELFDEDEIRDISEKTRLGGAEIVGLLKSGSAYYAPGESIAIMVESILKDQKKTICSCAYLDGEYGYKDIYVGVPCVIGKEGVERVIKLNLSSKIRKDLDEAINSIKSDLKE